MGKGGGSPSDRCFPWRPGPRREGREAGLCVVSMDGTSTSTWESLA